MSFFGKIWGGVKAVGGFIGKIVSKKKTAQVVNTVAAVVNSAQSDQGAVYNSVPVSPDLAEKPPGSSWLSFLSGNNPLDLNKYVTLPTVTGTVKSTNWLMIGGLVIGAVLLLRPKSRRYA